MRRIAFFGLINAFDFKHIGGVDSVVRRIALGLAKSGDSVDLVHYSAAQDQSFQIQDNIQQRLFKTFAESLNALDGQYDHIISIYLKPSDRIRFAHFRKKHNQTMTFHHFYFGWNESWLKRELLFVEAKLWPFNGYLFCVSPRIYRYVSGWAPKGELLLPPVPDSYFCKPDDKLNDGKLRVTYAGRVDIGKGTVEAIEVCRRVARKDDIEAHVCGFAWPHKQQTVQLHNELLASSNIIYEPVEYSDWAPQIDENLVRLLHKTDILLLPYKKLSSTIDIPLLLLEGMANLCAIITPPLGDLHKTYGPSYFNLTEGWNIDSIQRLIENARGHLEAERCRLMEQNSSLQFDTKSIVEKFRKLLCESTPDHKL